MLLCEWEQSLISWRWHVPWNELPEQDRGEWEGEWKRERRRGRERERVCVQKEFVQCKQSTVGEGGNRGGRRAWQAARARLPVLLLDQRWWRRRWRWRGAKLRASWYTPSGRGSSGSRPISGARFAFVQRFIWRAGVSRPRVCPCVHVCVCVCRTSAYALPVTCQAGSVQKLTQKQQKGRKRAQSRFPLSLALSLSCSPPLSFYCNFAVITSAQRTQAGLA